MLASTAFILSLLLPLSQALPSPVAVAPGSVALQRSTGQDGHAFAASANHKARLIRRRKASTKRSTTCGPRSPGPVILPAGASAATAAAAANATASSSSAAVSASVTGAVLLAPTPSSAMATQSSAASSAASSKTHTASSAASPVPTSPAQTSSLMARLFPTKGTNWWSTSTEANPSLSFTGALKPLTAGSLPPTSTAPDGSSALVAKFPAGTFKFSSSTGAGYSFYTEANKNGVSVEGAKEVIFSYSVYFEAGFDFVKGGKMPGLYGGTSLSQAKSCSGGRQDNRDECFSARLMWRTNGMGEIYNYLPTSIQQGGGYCQTAPMSICDTVYGDSIGRGSYTWATGAWTTVAMRIKLNDVGVANGEQQLWVDGQSIMNLSGLQLIVKPAKIYGIMAQTFFGGSDATWASPKDQSAWFKDWSMSVIS